MKSSKEARERSSPCFTSLSREGGCTSNENSRVVLENDIEEGYNVFRHGNEYRGSHWENVRRYNTHSRCHHKESHTIGKQHLIYLLLEESQHTRRFKQLKSGH